MSDDKKPKRIVGMRSRVVIGDEVPEDDENIEVLGQDVLVHVKPDQLEEGMEIVGVSSEVVVGGSRVSELIKTAMKQAQEVDPEGSKEIVEFGESALSAQDKPSLKERLAIFIEKCKDLAPLAAIVIKLVEVYHGM
jgi:hypothetical protein